MKSIIVFFGLCLLLSASSLLAEDPSFSVTIVGTRQYQEHSATSKLADQDKGCPWIKIPSQSSSNSELGPDRPTGHEFYVIIKNISKTSIRLNLSNADWYDCLTFQLTSPDGTIFHVKRPATVWNNNSGEPWIFQPNDLRVLTVDFTSGRWEGFPPESELPSGSQFKIKATFRYHDYDVLKKRSSEGSYDSAAIQAKNFP